jgi:hypothetical protein
MSYFSNISLPPKLYLQIKQTNCIHMHVLENLKSYKLEFLSYLYCMISDASKVWREYSTLDVPRHVTYITYLNY